MTIEQAIEILERHNKWRRGDDEIPETNPKELGEAIDTVVDNFKISTLNAAYLPQKVKDKQLRSNIWGCFIESIQLTKPWSAKKTCDLIIAMLKKEYNF